MVSSLVELSDGYRHFRNKELLWFLAAGNIICNISINLLNVIHNAPYLFPLWLETFDCSDLIFT